MDNLTTTNINLHGGMVSFYMGAQTQMIVVRFAW